MLEKSFERNLINSNASAPARDASVRTASSIDVVQLERQTVKPTVHVEAIILNFPATPTVCVATSTSRHQQEISVGSWDDCRCSKPFAALSQRARGSGLATDSKWKDA